MDINPYQPDKRGIPMFMLGAVIGFALFISTFLQDTESIIFAPLLSGDNPIIFLSCPEIITPQDEGVVRAKIHNPTEKMQYRSVRTHVSQGFLTLKREYYDHYNLEPGQTLPLSWQIGLEDAAYGYVILTKIYFLPQDPVPSYVGACGIMALDIPFFKGWHIIGSVVAVSFGLMGVGYFRYRKHNPLLQGRQRTLAVNLVVIAVTVTLGLATMFIESWYLELAFFIFTMLLLAESTFFFSQS